MVNLTRKTNTVEIVFSGSSTYLYDGKISAPLGSLVLITDQSDMATVRRAPSFDILFSAKIGDMEFGGTQATKDNINDLFNATCGGNSGGGGGGGDMSNYWTSAQTEAAISAATSGKANSSDVYTKAETDQTNRVISEALHELHDTKADTSAVTASISAATSGKANSSDVYTKQEVLTALGNKADISAMTTAIYAATSGKANSSDVYTKQQMDTALSGKADTSAVTASISAATSGKANSADVYTKTEMDTALSGKQNTLTAGSGVSISGDVISVTGGGAGGSTNIVTLTQAEYDALATKDPDTIYVISDAPSAYYAKTDVDNAPTSGSTNLLTSGTLYDVLGDIDNALANIIGGN